MTEVSFKAKMTLVGFILQYHKKMSYRKIASLITRTDENRKSILTGQTIGRIAKSKGKWFPKSPKILSALGVLVQQPKRKKISEMSTSELLWRLENREEF